MHTVNTGSKTHPQNQQQATAYALEVTGKDIRQVEMSASQIPPGTSINIAFLGNENHDQRVNAARVIRACGFEPVPIISSRRLCSERDLDNLLDLLNKAASPSRFIFVGRDRDNTEHTLNFSLRI